MPELPEVQTIVDDLNKKVKGLTITDVWTDWPKQFKRSSGGWEGFKKTVKGLKILKVWRLGKNIIFDLSDSKKILIHQKMTGHLLLGSWKLEVGRWVSIGKSKEMKDPKNGFIRLIFFLDKGKSPRQAQDEPMLALSDMRRFAKVLCGPKEKILNLPDLKSLGPVPDWLEEIPAMKYYEKAKKIFGTK